MLPYAVSASALHKDLNHRALLYAREHALLHDLTPGTHPSILFGEDERRHHGNFHPASYRAILAKPEWRERLLKVHTAHKRSRPRADWAWRELDCASSSDALLMNIFCHPQVLRSAKVAALLHCGVAQPPRFGVHPRLRMEHDRVDTTELDMEWGDLLVESKLTDSDFQMARPALLARYLEFADVFAPETLPRTADGSYAGYQLVRGVLAAAALDRSFCVMCDARRLDLMRIWQEVISAVRSAALRCRCKPLTWQELAGALPGSLRQFLAAKYGITPGP